MVGNFITTIAFLRMVLGLPGGNSKSLVLMIKLVLYVLPIGV